MLLKLLKKTKIRLKTQAILSIIFINKKVNMLISILKSQKTSSSLSNLYTNN